MDLYSRRGVSTIIATVLLVGVSVALVGLFYGIMNSYLGRPNPGFSPQIAMNVGASGFTTISVEVVNTGNVPLSSLSITVQGASGPSLSISYSSPIASGGGNATVMVRGISGGSWSAVSQHTSVSGDLQASVDSSYSFVIQAWLSNGGTYAQVYGVTAQP